MGLRRKFLYYEPRNFRLLPHSSGRQIPTECQHREGRSCLLLPTSNCDGSQMKSILDRAKKKDSVYVLDKGHCGKLQRDGIDTLDAIMNITKSFKVVIYKHTFQAACDLWKLQQSMNKPLTMNVSQRNGYELEYHEV